MVNYVCRTCLYVCDNEFSFRRLEKVKQILELFVPEIKAFLGKYSHICEQCYYFLKNVENFKSKCIETQRKLYSMNIETIKENHNAVLQSVVNEAPLKEQLFILAQSQFSSETIDQQRLKRLTIENNLRKSSKRSKLDLSVPVTSTVTSKNEITLTSLLTTSARPVVSISSSKKLFPVQLKETVSVQVPRPISVQSTKSVISVQSAQPVIPVQSAQPLFHMQPSQPAFPVQSTKPASLVNQKNEVQNFSAADELLQLFDNEITDLQSFREFAVKGANSNKEEESDKLKNGDVSKDNNTDIIINYVEDDDDESHDEYMTKSDLVSAGILSDDSAKPANVESQTESDSEDDPEIMEIDLEDDGDNAGVVELMISEKKKKSKIKKQIPKTVANTIIKNERSVLVPATVITKTAEMTVIRNEPKPVSIPAIAIIKQELPDDENPGFFNKQSSDGYYKCRLCDKHYKTSKGLYEHTKKVHNEVKFHHCDYCSFFTLWKSALVRHYSIFHMDIFEKNNPMLANCEHCSFQTRSKEQLSRHIIDTHVYEKFIGCNLCRARFADNVAFAKHVEKEHFIPAQNSEFCVPCKKLFLLKEDYVGHLEKEHKTTLECDQESSVIKEFCASCCTVFNSKDEFKEHNIIMHKALE